MNLKPGANFKGEIKMSEKDLTISEMKKMQLELYEVNKEKWNDMKPEYVPCE